MLTPKQIDEIIRYVRSLEKGQGQSDLDKAFKRGYRTALKLVQEQVRLAIEQR